MKLRIGKLEIIDPTPEELDRLIERYGDCVSDGGNGNPANNAESARRRTSGGFSPADKVVLEKLVSAGASGASTKEIGDILGRRGKSIRRGLIEWARRLGIADNGIDPFEDCRAGTKRGVRLSQSFLPVGQALLKG